jgi:hypothetical protein
MRFTTFIFLLAVSIGALLGARTVNAQDLGHKLPGLIGLDAGRVPEPGLYLIDRALSYGADELHDRSGNLIPIGNLQFRGRSNAVGISYTMMFPGSAISLTSTFAAPLARIRLNIQDRPEANFDRFGLADIYIQPARLGLRRSHFDLVASYGLYLPTDTSALAGGKGLSSGHVTHEFSAGGAIYTNSNRTTFVTALASYELNLRNRGIDIIRGDTLQVQGGAGWSRFDRLLEAGLAGYALWQVRPDRGADIPPVFRGARDNVYGLGPDAAILVKAIHSQIRIRYAWDLSARSRPQGNIFVLGLNFIAHRPRPSGTP